MPIENERRQKPENERRRKRYAEDPEYRKKEIDRGSAYRAANRTEINERRRRRLATDPEFRAKRNARRAENQRARLLRRYGISSREYELRLALQNGACAICEKKPKGLLCVDHCHRTGKVRGLLCKRCNSGLGFYEDNPKLTRAATIYLTAFYESLEPTGDVMIPTDEQTETGKDGRPMRSAILLELRCQPGKADDGATDNLRLIARKLVAKAAEGDIQAIKEVLDRIDGKTVAGAADGEQGPRRVSIRWKDPPSDS